MFSFRRLTRTIREITPVGSDRAIVFDDIERIAEWSLMTDGRSFYVARWSPSSYVYIDTNLLPIESSAKNFTHAMPLGIKSIIEIPRFIGEHEDDSSS